MSLRFASFSLIATALMLAFVLGGSAPAHAARSDVAGYVLVNSCATDRSGVDCDLGEYHKNDVNQFGDDRAYSGFHDSDRDADFRAHNFVPETYGLMGDYSYDSGPGSGS